jgi:hypothetical protein
VNHDLLEDAFPKNTLGLSFTDANLLLLGLAWERSHSPCRCFPSCLYSPHHPSQHPFILVLAPQSKSPLFQLICPVRGEKTHSWGAGGPKCMAYLVKPLPCITWRGCLLTWLHLHFRKSRQTSLLSLIAFRVGPEKQDRNGLLPGTAEDAACLNSLLSEFLVTSEGPPGSSHSRPCPTFLMEKLSWPLGASMELFSVSVTRPCVICVCYCLRYWRRGDCGVPQFWAQMLSL